jgi:hypothetical protein
MTALPEMSVAAAARMLGVSRQRVYQRVAGAGAEDNKHGRPLDATVRPSEGRGTRDGVQIRIELDVVLAWREERIAAGLPVGPIPAHLWRDVVPKPPEIPATFSGFPNINPF